MRFIGFKMHTVTAQVSHYTIDKKSYSKSRCKAEYKENVSTSGQYFPLMGVRITNYHASSQDHELAPDRAI